MMEDNVERLLPESISEDQELCGVCHRPKSWHDKDTVRHQFNAYGSLVAKKPPSIEQPNNTRGLPSGDPVLRLLLLRKGVITIEDIEAIEKELKAAGVGYANTVTRSGGEDSQPNERQSS